MPDFFEEIIKRDSTTQIVGGGGASPTGTYFTIDNNLSEGDPSDLRTNIGLADSTADLDISSLITGDLRINEGKITSPVDYQLRNAGDTDYRNVSIANATIGQHALNLQTAESLFISAQRELTFKGLDGVTVDPETQDLTEDRTWEIKVDIDDPLEFNLGNIGIKDHGLNQRGVLNTATQDIYGAKTFDNDLTANSDMILGNQASNTSHAVRADRSLTISSDSDSVIEWQENTKNLVTDPTWIPSIANHGFNQRGVLSTQTQNIYGRKQFQSESQFTEDIFLDKGQRWDDFESFVRSTTFAGGFAGSGIEIDKVDGRWVATVDGLVVRDFARFYELIVEKVRATGGTLIVNDGMRVESVEQTADGSWSFTETEFNPFYDYSAYKFFVEEDGGEIINEEKTEPLFEGEVYAFANRFRCFIEEDVLIEFAKDDLVKAQTYTGRGVDVVRGVVYDVEGGSPTPTVNDPKRWFEVFVDIFNPAYKDYKKAVEDDGGEIINPSKTSDLFGEGEGAPKADDDFVRLGNVSDTDRQGGVILTSSDIGSPYIRMYNGLDSWNKEGTTDIIKYQSGRLDNLVDPDFPSLDGTQENLYGVYVDGGFFNNVEVRGNITVLGGNAATKDYVDDQAGGNVTIRSATAPSERTGGGALEDGDTWIKTDEGNLPYTYDGTDPYDISGWIRDYTIINGGNIETGTVTLDRLDFQENGRILGENLSIDTNTTFTDNVTIKGTLDGVDGTFSGTLSAVDGEFTGTLNGVDGSFSGELQAVTGNFGNVGIATGGSISGSNWQIDETKWVHPSLGGPFYAFESVANTGTNNSAPPFGFWISEQEGQGNNELIVLRKVYRHRFGNKHLNLSAFLRVDNDAPNATSLDNELRISVGGVVSKTIDITTASYSNYNVTLDVSGATVGQDYTLNLIVISRINEGQFDDIARTQLRGDFSIDSTVE